MKHIILFVRLLIVIVSIISQEPSPPPVRILIDDFGYDLEVMVNAETPQNEETHRDIVRCVTDSDNTLGCSSTLFLQANSPSSEISSFADKVSSPLPEQFTGGLWTVISPEDTPVVAIMQFNSMPEYQADPTEGGFTPPIDFFSNSNGMVLACESKVLDTTIQLILTSEDGAECLLDVTCMSLGTFLTGTPPELLPYESFSGSCDLTAIVATQIRVDISDNLVKVYSVYVSGAEDTRPSGTPSTSLSPSLTPTVCSRGNYYYGRNKCINCDVDHCPVFRKPIVEVQWSIYHDSCIRWNVRDIPVDEETVTLSLEYGLTDFDNEMVIVPSFASTMEYYSWVPHGVYPSPMARVKMTFDKSGLEVFSATFEVIAPNYSVPNPNSCI